MKVYQVGLDNQFYFTSRRQLVDTLRRKGLGVDGRGQVFISDSNSEGEA